jgi:hypothetical protein
MSEETERKDGVAAAALIQTPFKSQYLPGEREETGFETLTIRINKAERARINRMRRILNYGQDAKVIKAALILAENVTLGTFGADLMGKLTDPNRRRPLDSDRKENDENRKT